MNTPGKTGRSHFVADLHLTDERPAATGRFFRFLEDEVAGADALYILGDLFEAWIGDDHDEAVAHETAQRLRQLAAAGTSIYFMHGNRDFMLAERYAARAGMQLIADPCVIDLYGTRTLLMHGDTLCVDDLAYQRFRRRVRRPMVIRLLRALPFALRNWLAGRARAGSESAKSAKSADIMDVNTAAVAYSLRAYGVCRLIHGHTHRPARHDHAIDGQTCERWVLPDWYARWGYVVCDAQGCTLAVAPL
ncbi:MAG: UDP-2,3-diacylglucosamine diphosphatase [Thiobacillus sp. 65-69]|nr:UDP-2,3-diacylglucosamine diphosphatase [Thiobacillus sp.]ODU88450.1 MAG: UDP-2,3-diacylglucosamine diphosphatase [Thiobacillus sp. SCN 65-179]OJW36466.1 MAG: UDP-2,3-diacylglucosamine diphosphatase [Thiobacillus sp. 65-69]